MVDPGDIPVTSPLLFTCATVASLVVQATGARETVSWTASSTTSANAVGSRVNDVSPGWVVPPQPVSNKALAVSRRGIAAGFIDWTITPGGPGPPGAAVGA